MTLLDRALARATTAAPQAAKALPAALRVDARQEYYNLPDVTKIEQQTRLYQKLSWVQIAVRIVAQTCAATPYRVKGAGGDIPDHPFLETLRRPNPAQSRTEFLEATFSWRLGAGNCYWWLNRPNAETPPSEIWILPAGQVEPVPDGAMGVRGYLYDPGDGHKVPLETWEVVHFKTWNPHSRYVGLSPLEALAYDANADIAAQVYNANFYGRDNAKAAGILAFGDYIDDGAWKRLAEDLKDQHGGAKNNRIMRLRGVGPGGVQWLPTQLSQAETKYLEVRTFTKEEVYEIFAPGLSSMLAVNSTEANSVSGKDTFLSMAVYPQHVAVAEKLDSDILPAYGADLDGEFDDVRRTDTETEIKQQGAAAQVMTVDEMRETYYGLKPLGDERGALLASDRKGVAPAQPVLDPAIALQQAQKRVDRERWQAKAIKALARGASPDVPFTPDYLDDDEAMTIRAALKRARTPAQVRAALGNDDEDHAAKHMRGHHNQQTHGHGGGGRSAEEVDADFRGSASLVADKKLKPDERTSLQWYQSNGHDRINAELRGTEAVRDKGTLDRTTQNLDSIMARSRTPSDVTAHRGMLLETPEAQAYMATWKPGATIRDPGYMSTTIDRTVAENFGAGVTPYPGLQTVDMRVHVPAGTPAIYMPTARPQSMTSSGPNNEHELLLARNLQYRVVSRTEEGGKVTLEVEVVQ